MRISWFGLISPLLYSAQSEIPPSNLLPNFQPSSDPATFSRRTLLQAAAGFVQLTHEHGRVTPPTPVPDVQLRLQDGSSASLRALTQGRATAVQLMFTECSTTCPIQAAIFQKVQRLIPNMAASRTQLLSLSVDPMTDTPRALSAWLGRFQATPSWNAAAPSAKDGPLLQNFFGGGLTALTPTIQRK